MNIALGNVFLPKSIFTLKHHCLSSRHLKEFVNPSINEFEFYILLNYFPSKIVHKYESIEMYSNKE